MTDTDPPTAPADTNTSTIITDAAGPPAREVTRSRVLDLVGLGTAVMLCAGFVTFAMIPAWSPRLAILLVVLPAGAILLVDLARRRDLATVLLLAGLAWTAVTSVTQDAPMLRLFGMVGLEASLLIYCGAAACWAVGRSLSERARSVLPLVIVAGLAINAAIGYAQVLFDVRSGPFVLVGNRAHGLTSYSVYFGALMSAAAVLVAVVPTPQRLRPLQLLGILYFATAGGMSGSRVALVAAIGCVAYLAVRERTTWSLACVGAVLGGTALGSILVTQLLGPANEGSDSGSSLERLGVGGDGSGGVGWRIDGWTAGLEAFVERPITGWGVGNFRQAIQRHLGGGFTQQTPRFDAHNIIVEWLVAVGVVGCLLFVAVAVVCARQARGPLAIGAVAVGLTWLLQPAGLSTLPLALLMLGAAMPSAALRRRFNDGPLPTHLGVALSIGTLLAVVFMVNDVRLERAAEVADRDGLTSVATWYPFDPNVADFVAQAIVLDWAENDRDPSYVEPALTWSQRAVDRQPDAPLWLDQLATRQLAFEMPDEALTSLRAALELQPTRVETWNLLRLLAEGEGDDELLAESTAMLCELRGRYCDE